MKRLSKDQIIGSPLRLHTISFFNKLVGEYKPEVDLGTQVIETYTTMGINLLVASIDCDAPFATCMDLLSALAASTKALETLSEHKSVVMDFEQFGDEQIKFATFFERETEDVQSFFQFTIYGDGVMVVIPALENLSEEVVHGSWLLNSLAGPVTTHRQQIAKKTKSNRKE